MKNGSKSSTNVVAVAFLIPSGANSTIFESQLFFCAVSRLRKKAYAIPNRDKSIDILPDSLPKQKVVRIDIEPEPMQLSKPEPMQVMPATYLDNSHTIEIDVHGINIRVFNSVDRELLKTVLSALGGA